MKTQRHFYKNIILTIIMVLLFLSVSLMSACNDTKDIDGLPKVVNIGTQPLPNDEKIAIYKKFFEQEMGVEVNIIEFRAGEIRNAMIAKSIDFAMLGSSSAILGIANGMDAQIIWLHEVLGDAEQLVVRKGASIQKVEDLVGKKVAAPFSSTAHYSLLKALEHYGVSEKEVILLDMQMPEVYAAWQRGDIDAAYAWEPTLSELLKGGSSLVSSKYLAEQGILTSNVEIVRGDFARNYPDLTAKYIKAVNKAVELYRNDTQDAVQSIATIMELEYDETLAFTKGSIWLNAKEQLGEDYFGTVDNPGRLIDSVMDTADFLYSQNELISKPDASLFAKAVNPYFIQRALELD